MIFEQIQATIIGSSPRFNQPCDFKGFKQRNTGFYGDAAETTMIKFGAKFVLYGVCPKKCNLAAANGDRSDDYYPVDSGMFPMFKQCICGSLPNNRWEKRFSPPYMRTVEDLQ